MGCRHVEDGFECAEVRIGALPVIKMPRNCSWAYSKMLANLSVFLARVSGYDRFALTGLGIFDPFQIVWQRIVEPPVNVQNGNRICRILRQSSFIDPALDGDMRDSFLLQVAGFWVGALLARRAPAEFRRDACYVLQ